MPPVRSFGKGVEGISIKYQGYGSRLRPEKSGPDEIGNWLTLAQSTAEKQDIIVPKFLVNEGGCFGRDDTGLGFR